MTNTDPTLSADVADYLRDRWDEGAAPTDPVERLVYRSNLLGADARITNTGGGNTSSKIAGVDPLTGDPVDVLWVKGSGGDLRTAGREHFASLDLVRFEHLRARYEAESDRGAKSAIEDAMVGLYAHAVHGLNPRPPSIDTPLHALLRARHVDHTHPVPVIALAAAEDGERLTHQVYGDEVGWVPWQRPGFDLGVRMAELVSERPQLRGIVMGQHGLICWADDDVACYRTSLELIAKAERFLRVRDRGADAFGGARVQPLDAGERRALLARSLPRVRGMLSSRRRMLATVVHSPDVLAFVSSRDAPRLAELGTSCPDHFLRTKIKPLLVDWEPVAGAGADAMVVSLVAALERGLGTYRSDYAEYYDAHRTPDSPAIRDANPTVLLIPGVGMIAWGKTKSESRVTAEFYGAAIGVMRGAESVSRYRALPPQEAFDIEYWALEEAKLQRMPPEREFERNVALVIGGGSGIGRAAAERMAAEGAHVAVADLDRNAAEETAAMLLARHGRGIGVAGQGLAGCGPAVALAVDITDRSSIRRLIDDVVHAYGGIDHVIVTAGVFHAPDEHGRIADDEWGDTFAINVTGGYFVADEAQRVWQAQGLPGTLVLTTSVNAAVPKRGSLAYDASKAAANHLVRELAIELAPLVRVNGLAPATVVEGSSMFPRERVVSSLAKYGIAFDDGEDTEALRSKLAHFYAQRTLTKSPITLADQAEVAYLLSSKRFTKTTGQIFSVDGGLHEAFLR
jgi:rhamnulose-1-phosphate aldolase/alcohol dehydrogenase